MPIPVPYERSSHFINWTLRCKATRREHSTEWGRGILRSDAQPVRDNVQLHLVVAALDSVFNERVQQPERVLAECPQIGIGYVGVRVYDSKRRFAQRPRFAGVAVRREARHDNPYWVEFGRDGGTAGGKHAGFLKNYAGRTC